MNPILFRLPFTDTPYHAYGFFLAVAFLMGMSLSIRHGRKEGVPSNETVTLVFICVITSLAGSRLLHLLMVEREAFFADPGLFFDFARGGYAFYGGFIFAVVAALIYCRWKGRSFLHIADVFSPGLVFGLAFGRIGCLLAGCCHGRPIADPLPAWLAGVLPLKWPEWFSLTFPSEAGGLGGLLDQPLVPTQPMSGLYSLGLYLVLALIVAPRKRYHGQVFVWLCILYAIARSSVELLRGDDRGLYFNEMFSTSQLVSVPVILVGFSLLIWLRTRLNSGALKPLPEGWREEAHAKLPAKERHGDAGKPVSEHVQGKKRKKKGKKKR